MTLYITKNYSGWKGCGKDSFHDGNNHFKYYNSILLIKNLIGLQSQTITKNSLQNLSGKLPYLKNNEYLSAISFFIPTGYPVLKNKNIPPEFFECLFKELENFSLLLKLYLQFVSEDFQKNSKQIFQINFQDGSGDYHEIFVDKVLSFNYTRTVDMYIGLQVYID